jgi:hypothetical protein
MSTIVVVTNSASIAYIVAAVIVILGVIGALVGGGEAS